MSTPTTKTINFYRCFGCDRVTRDETKVRIAADGFLRCDECAAYEASLPAESLIEVWQVTEWKHGCVYMTEYVEDRWVPMGTTSLRDSHLVLVPKSTSFTGKTTRTRKEES